MGSAVQTSGPRVPSLVVMGVSGCGKSSLGAALARALGRPLIEGDDFHPPSNRAKMAAGQALTDADRAGWLDTLAAQLAAHPQGAVLTCSALKRAYRDRLRAAAPGLRFAFLAIDRAAAQQRVAQRADHFFSPTLVDSQFAALEPPTGEPGVIEVDALAPLVVARDAVLTALGAPLAPVATGAAAVGETATPPQEPPHA